MFNIDTDITYQSKPVGNLINYSTGVQHLILVEPEVIFINLYWAYGARDVTLRTQTCDKTVTVVIKTC